MVAFFVYDLIFLGLFILFVVLFLYKNRRNLHTEKMLGLPVYLYKTKLGMKAIDYAGEKYKGALHFIKYISIAFGFVLMAGIIYILLKSVYIYAVFPQITQIIKAPPITPLIPYFPQLFGVQSLFPPFYFTYFIVAIAIVAVVHEFSHGVYMKLFRIKIKSTGFAFFGPFLGAFVEQDEKSFSSKKNLAQMSVLSAGVFANIVFALIFFLLLVGFFFLFFQPAGYIFNSYAYSIIPNNATIVENSSGLTQISLANKTFFLDNSTIGQLNTNASYIIAFDDAPAIRSGLQGVIFQINNEKIRNQKDLSDFLAHASPGDNVTIKTLASGSVNEYHIALGGNPTNSSRAYLGVGSAAKNTKGAASKFIALFSGFRDPNTFYSPRFDGNLVIFIYDLLWWVMIINLLVGLFNMLPAGPFDGGRFLYLGILSATRSEKISRAIYRVIGWAVALIFILLIVFWFLGII
jgi:membrane-associated protease RseP (regulator of RpoE activity)